MSQCSTHYESTCLWLKSLNKDHFISSKLTFILSKSRSTITHLPYLPKPNFDQKICVKGSRSPFPRLSLELLYLNLKKSKTHQNRYVGIRDWFWLLGRKPITYEDIDKQLEGSLPTNGFTKKDDTFQTRIVFLEGTGSTWKTTNIGELGLKFQLLWRIIFGK